MADAVSFRTLPMMERMRAAPRILEVAQPAGGVTLAEPRAVGVQPTAPAPAAEPQPAAVAATVTRIPTELLLAPGAVSLRPMPLPTVPTPPPVAPAVSAGNPFVNLPQPNPGDPIKADHFRQFSRCLQYIQHACMLSASVFGRTLAEAKPVIAAEGFGVQRVMSVFGTTLGDGADASLDQRRVVQVAPVALGEPGLLVVVTEAVETRRLAPNVLGLTYAEAAERLRAAVGDATFPRAAGRVGELVGRTLGDATRGAVIPTT